MSAKESFHAALNKLEKAIKYNFKNKQLLIEAVSHPSLKQQVHTHEIKDYERLELLGDAVLGFIITETLYKNYTSDNEGKLAKIKAFLVCKDTLCKVASKLKLADYIIMTEGEEISGGRENPNNIENVMEAVLAAIYLDSKIETVRTVIQDLWAEFLEEEADYSDIDPKTALQEWAQSKGRHAKPIYEVLAKEGLAHTPIFTIKVSVGDYSFTAKGHSMKAAEKDSARGLLKFIKNHNL